MLEISKDVDSTQNPITAPLAQHEATSFVKALSDAGESCVVSINGKIDLVVEDAGSYDKLFELVDRLEAIEGIKRGLNDMEAGRTRPLKEVIAEKKKKYGL